MSEPYFNDEEIANDFYYLIGRIIVSWSAVERGVDNILVMSGIFRSKEGKAIISLQAKINALRALFGANPNLKNKLDIVDKIQTMARFRNGIIHGYCSGMTNSEPPRILFRKSLYHSDDTETEQLTPSISELVEFLQNVRKVDEELVPLSIGIAMSLKPKSEKSG